MISSPTVSAGFARPSEFSCPQHRRNAMLAQLIATSTLAVSIMIAVIAVSIAIARANAAAPNNGCFTTRLATASIAVIVLSGLGGLTVIAAQARLNGDGNTPPD